jgi:hypothetical protein
MVKGMLKLTQKMGKDIKNQMVEFKASNADAADIEVHKFGLAKAKLLHDDRQKKNRSISDKPEHFCGYPHVPVWWLALPPMHSSAVPVVPCIPLALFEAAALCFVDR